ncbi:tRNA (N6-threonylcarbamoyladenosine(37)-N6)-methyltransferase TrmO [Pasteurellaceae bacterium HPA106]|uniref:tRNA (N6-threonylcarbamoyladenosine(37)-N6)-methyltransferase TrmO n=1 Tax=Spirabiliibacterium pneumoniae TaxID=221400 RepID=UPI001AADD343|nr:tRNA (N6-threonylcarbamoyladenosine(37)-N6)-methyltransferase TrmO [Spirabiliibacterium pneumoniae]MBE2896937.1 tRNA (N6-threonylcarbamoyladenosine(37)-N6)-methyltransferase TrmO [Spirabiliibacterium pneumoniae]
MTALCLEPIAIAHTPYNEKFSVPRQPKLSRYGTGEIELLPPYNHADCVRGLAQFSHIWLIFQFDKIPAHKWSPTVRPPRLGGNQRMGVFATRATHRPNALGLSLVALEEIHIKKGSVRLHVGSIDLVNGTPIFDIKPYLAYADSEVNAKCGFASEAPVPSNITVHFSPQAKRFLQSKAARAYPHLQEFIVELITQDPRPAYQHNQYGREYGLSIWAFNVRFVFQDEHCACVQSITAL